MYDDIKKWYEWGLWTKEMVHEAVPDLITPEEYETITGDPYVPGDDEATIPDYEEALEELGVIDEEE